MKVRITMVKPSPQKLSMVKIIKDYTGFGLKDSKNIVDELHAFPNKSIEFELSAQIDLNRLSKDLKGVGG